MNLSTKLFLLIIVIIVGLAGVFSDRVKQWFEPASVTAVATDAEVEDTTPSQLEIEPINGTLELDEIQFLVLQLPPASRQELLSNSDNFQLFIQQEMIKKSMLNLLLADGVKDQAAVQFLMKKSAEKVLLEWYLSQLIKRNMTQDFPSPQQIEASFDAEKEKYAIGERVHLWQILFAIPDDASEETIAEIEATAAQIRDKLVNKDLSFDEAALTFSENSKGRDNGGYVGLVNMDGIDEKVREQIAALAEGEISTPIRTDTAIHIIKRGSKIASRQLELEQVSEYIKKSLREQEEQRIRQSLIEEAKKRYPGNIEENTIEQWRLKLRSNL